jgi:hypothetical protein
VLALVTCAT